jgi:hypothetical protein
MVVNFNMEESSTPLHNPNIKVSNKLTRMVKKASIGLSVICIFGVITTFAAHGGYASIGSDLMIFGGGAAILSIIGWGALHFGRDRRQVNKAKEEFKRQLNEGEEESFTQDIGEEISCLKPGSELRRKITLNGKIYMIEVLKSNNGIGRVNIKNE